MNVLILAPYSYPSACGIWKRVYNDAVVLQKKGHFVTIFTSNIVKGTSKTSEKYSNLDGIEIYRFPIILKLGGTAMIWLFFRKLVNFKPDIIHTHGYRHPHSLFSLVLGKVLGKKVIITTHAPFKKDPRRSVFLKFIDKLYDALFGWWELRLYNKVISISKWEKPFLKRRGVKKSKYIPNGIEKEFIHFKPKDKKEPSDRIIFMGRLDPVKRVEWIVQAAQNLEDKHFVLYGPLQGYSNETLKNWEAIPNLEIISRKYEKHDFIKWVSESDIYVLPSIRESLGITLLEAMALGVVPIASNALGPMDIIENNENGFIIHSPRELIEAIVNIYTNWDEMHTPSKNAKKTSNLYDGEKLGEELVRLYDILLTS